MELRVKMKPAGKISKSAMPPRKMAPKKAMTGKLSPAMASRIRVKANKIMGGLPKADKDSAAGAAT